MNNPHIDLLNRRLGEELGFVMAGSRPRFAWKYAPEEFMLFYSTSGSVSRRRWADIPGPGGLPIGRSWLLAGWRKFTDKDHYGFGTGVRVALPAAAGYSPHFESLVYPEGALPSEKLNANYIWALRQQLAASVEQDAHSFENYMMEEKYNNDRLQTQYRKAWHEDVCTEYDKYVGAYGNLEPGKRDGYMSLPSTSKDVLEGFGGI